MVSLTVLTAIALPWWARRALSPAQRICLGRSLSVLLSATVVVWTCVRLVRGEFDRTTDLPLDLCNLAALLLPGLMWTPSERVHNVLYFWVLVGTAQAVLTPHLEDGFPHYTFLKYWIVHGGLIVAAVYFTVALRLFPRARSIVIAFGWLQVYTVGVFAANVLIDANYFYVLRKPPTASLLDVMGPWPWYLLVCELLTLLLFGVAYLPIHWRSRAAGGGVGPAPPDAAGVPAGDGSGTRPTKAASSSSGHSGG